MKSKSPVSLEVYMPSTAGKYSKISIVIWPFVDLQLYEKLLVRKFSSRYEKIFMFVTSLNYQMIGN